jgi:tRNA dimethylallyltransferase
LLAGGSMMYIDAVCKGLDEIPTVTPSVRQALWEQYERDGLASILDELKTADPVHYLNVDRRNHKRVIHAVEICRMTGLPYSSFCIRKTRKRPFRIISIGLFRPREELYERINRRVDRMMADGLTEEARRVYPFRHLNALNTVGYKELFRYFDGEWSLDTAVEKIKRNTRVYARKQMTWFKRDKSICWFHPDDKAAISTCIEQKMSS